jgi:signal transduction histidine kinase
VFSIRRKVAAALLLPVLAVAALSWSRVSDARDERDEVEAQTALASAILTPGGALDALVVEQGLLAATAVGFGSSAGIPITDPAEAQRLSDEALATLRDNLEHGSPQARAAFELVLGGIDEDLATARQAFSEIPEPYSLDNLDMANEVYDIYAESLWGMTHAIDAVTAQINDPEMRAAATLLAEVSRMQFAYSKLIQRTATSYAGGTITQGFQRDSIVRWIELYERNRSDIIRLEDGPWADQVQAFSELEPYTQASRMAAAALSGQDFDLGAFIELTNGLGDMEQPVDGSLRAVNVAANDALAARIDDLRSEADETVRNYTIGALGLIALALIIALLIVRSITRPIRELTRQADTMATESLPGAVQSVLATPLGSDVRLPHLEPVTVHSRDELQDVAESLNEVQRSAVDLAVEQATLRHAIADSLASLGRRTQGVIDEQLDLISRLEAEESEPAVLENLFRLDHLISRARRNAESLVILAGAPSPVDDDAAFPVVDVVRAALSEVADYQRVTLDHVDPGDVSGSTGADLSHLLAELLENAVQHSPSGSMVQVIGRDYGDAYRITIVDQGLGMSPEALATANRRLAGEEDFTVAPSRYLGHYVAGTLAERVGCRVELTRAGQSGITATVSLPRTLLLEADDVDGIAERRSTVDLTEV